MKAVFINVFGGILRVDRLAEGIIAAVKKLGLKLPVVLRAEGTNVEQGKKMLAESGPRPRDGRRHGRGRQEGRWQLAQGRDGRMSILVDKATKVLVQGITGKEGTFHALRCKEYGTQVVGGVTPGKGGTTHEGFAVWNTVAEAVKATGADCALIFVPPPAAADAIMEAADAGMPLVVCITEGVPVRDMVRVKAFLARTDEPAHRAQLPGLISPGKAKIGIMPGHIHKEGPHRRRLAQRHPDLRGGAPADPARPRAVLLRRHRRRSGQRHQLHRRAPPLPGRPADEAIMMIGEIGGSAEEEAAAFIKAHVTKPVVGFICGQTAPPGRRMGHAGAIIAGGKGTAAEKMKAMEAAGITTVKSPADMGTHGGPRRRQKIAVGKDEEPSWPSNAR